jgi:hypothetical protein
LTCIKKYDNYFATGDTFSAIQKLRILQCSVDGLQAFVSRQYIQNRPTMTFQQFIPLLLSAAAAHDNNLKLSKSHAKKQQIHLLGQEPYDSDSDN